MPACTNGIRFVSLLASLCFCALVEDSAIAAPLIKVLRPLGARRGTTFTLTLMGQNLVPGSELITALPATITRLAPPNNPKKPETELPFLVELHRDAPVALYPVRLRSEDGISNLVLFSVSDFPEIEVKKEEEPKDTPPSARKISPPVVVNSFLTAAAQDVFVFNARLGQSLVFEVEARRLGSAIDPIIRILDGAGREIAANDDAPGIGVDSRLQVKFPRDGEYRVVVHDSRFSDQESSFYRLKVGNYLYAESLFPLGWQRGKDIEVTLLGGNLPGPIVVHPPLDLPASQTIAMIPVPPAKGGSLPMPFVLGDLPEIIEPPATQTPVSLAGETVVNGRISKPGERDLYRLAVTPGERWFFEVMAAGLETTPMIAWLGLYDTQMKLLSSAVDGGSLIVQTEFSFAPPEKGFDPKLLFRVPENVREVLVAVEDLNHRGGPDFAYRLRATRKFEEFALELASPYINIPAGGTATVPVRVIRHTYQGPIQLGIANAGDGLLVEGGHVPANIKEGMLVVTSRPGVKLSTSELEVWGEGVSSAGERIRRRAAGPGLMTPVKGARREVGGGSIATQRPYQAKWLGMALPAGISRPVPLSLEVSDREIQLVQGLKREIRVTVNKNVPIAGSLRVEGQVPAGIDVDIKAGTLDEKKESLPVQISANYNARIGRFDLVLVARTDAAGRELTVVSPCVTVDLVRAFSLVIPSDSFEMESGADATIEGRLHRQYPFQEAVQIKAVDLPLHVTGAPVEVPATDSAFKLHFETEPAAESGEYEIRLVATAKMEGRKDDRDYTIPDKKLRLKILKGSISK